MKIFFGLIAGILMASTAFANLPYVAPVVPIAPVAPIVPVVPVAPIVPVVPVAPQAYAEFQIFLNYRSFNNYDAKIVSTFDRPASAGWVYLNPGQIALNGACYFGDPAAAIDLFNAMVAIYNAESGRQIAILGSVVIDPRKGTPALHIDELNEVGQVFSWFPMMNLCIRPATPAERAADVYPHQP
jgi:hypothetical protein